LKSGDAHDFFKKTAQRIGGCLAIELPVMHQFLSHGAFNKESNSRADLLRPILLSFVFYRFFRAQC